MRKIRKEDLDEFKKDLANGTAKAVAKTYDSKNPIKNNGKGSLFARFSANMLRYNGIPLVMAIICLVGTVYTTTVTYRTVKAILNAPISYEGYGEL